MKQIDFYKEGTTLMYVKRDIQENFFLNLLSIFMLALFFGFFTLYIPIDWLQKTLFIGVSVFLLFWLFAKDFTEKSRPQNSKYFLYVINNNFIYERITPEKEGFNKDNELIKFEIVKFIDEKGGGIKIISNKELPWGKRKIQIAKEYLPYKHQIIKYLNKNYTMSKIESETSILLKKHFT